MSVQRAIMPASVAQYYTAGCSYGIQTLKDGPYSSYAAAEYTMLGSYPARLWTIVTGLCYGAWTSIADCFLEGWTVNPSTLEFRPTFGGGLVYYDFAASLWTMVHSGSNLTCSTLTGTYSNGASPATTVDVVDSSGIVFRHDTSGDWPKFLMAQKNFGNLQKYYYGGQAWCSDQNGHGSYAQDAPWYQLGPNCTNADTSPGHLQLRFDEDEQEDRWSLWCSDISDYVYSDTLLGEYSNTDHPGYTWTVSQVAMSPYHRVVAYEEFDGEDCVSENSWGATYQDWGYCTGPSTACVNTEWKTSYKYHDCGQLKVPFMLKPEGFW